MASMEQIEVAAKKFSEARTALVLACSAMQVDLQGVKAKHIEKIKSAVAVAKSQHAEVAKLVQRSPGLFTKPRSVVLHGVKLGYEKAKGQLLIADPAKTIELIKKFFKPQKDILINTKETPVKKALSQLTADDLKKLAVEVTADGDVVFVKDQAAEVDKLVGAFLAEEGAAAEEDDE